MCILYWPYSYWCAIITIIYLQNLLCLPQLKFCTHQTITPNSLLLSATSNRHCIFCFCMFDYCMFLVARLCPTLFNPMDCSLPGSSVHGHSPSKNTGVDCQALLQGIFPTQGSNPGFPQCRQILDCLSQQGSSHYCIYIIEVRSPFLRGLFHLTSCPQVSFVL